MRRHLTVDHDRDLADNPAEILRDRGDDVAPAESGREALALARAQPFGRLHHPRTKASARR